MKPPQEARPIPFAWLDAPQRTAIAQVHEALAAIVEENRGAPAIPPKKTDDNPWATIDIRRSNRALFLNGPRGMGKSSVLVTLLHGWGEAGRGVDGDWSAFTPGSEDAKATFAQHPNQVRALPVRDFNPLADQIPLRAWLLQSFHDLSQRADGERPSSRGKELPTALEHADGWGDLFKRAIAGWESVRTPARAVLEQIVDHRLQVRSSYDFGRQFRLFLDGLLAALHKRKVLPSADTLLVVPIDDLDLQVDRVHELLDALRLLHHPRLVWLCAGDWDHLVQAVADDVEGAMTRQVGRKGDPVRARDLAVALCAKTFPLRLELRPLVLKEVLAAEGGRVVGLLDKLVTTRTSTREPLGSWLKGLASADAAPLLTWRQLRHQLDALREEPSRADALVLLRTILDPHGARTRVLGDRPDKGASGWVEYREGGHVEVRSLPERDHTLFGGGRVRTSRSLVFSGSPGARLAMSIAGVSDAVVTDTKLDPGPLLAWTELPGALVPWPFVERGYSPVDLLALAERWDVWVGSAEAYGKGLDALVYGWIAVQAGEEPDVEVLEGDQLIEVAPWKALLERVTPNADAALSDWIEGVVPLLVAPEYGMSDLGAEALARACAHVAVGDDDGLLTVLVGNWHENRTSLLVRNALGLTPLGEVDLSTEVAVDALDRRLAVARPDAPWYRLRDPEGWWVRAPTLHGLTTWLRANERRKFLFETPDGRTTVVGRMFGRGVRALGLTTLRQVLSGIGGGLAAVVSAYRHLAASLDVQAGGEPDGHSWRALATQVEILPRGRGVRVAPSVQLKPLSARVNVERPYLHLAGWEVGGLDAPEPARGAMAAWLGLVQLECAAAGVTMEGFTWSAPALLVVEGEELPLPPFPRWADVQFFASAWEARLAEFETAPVSPQNRTEWLLVAYLDLAVTLFAGPWADQWRARTPPEYALAPIQGNWNVLQQEPVSPALKAWGDAIRTGRSYRCLPDELRESFLRGDKRFNTSS